MLARLLSKLGTIQALSNMHTLSKIFRVAALNSTITGCGQATFMNQLCTSGLLTSSNNHGVHGIGHHTWVIHVKSTQKKILTLTNFNKTFVFTVSVEILTHSEFQRSAIYGFRVRTRQKKSIFF